MSIVPSRRKFLAGAASTLAIAATSRNAVAIDRSTDESLAGKVFPKGFRWGAATAGHQIEGNNVNSDLWVMENVKPTLFAERSGDACDSLHRYRDDIALLAGIGLNSYRFSVEWSRIEPTRGAFSIAQLDYYQRVIACCREHNVAPAVTFFHNAAPAWFAEAGGWLNPESPALFANYCSRVARSIGDGMEYAFTINEPQVALGFRAITGSNGAMSKRDAAELAAHEAAARARGCKQFITMNYPDIDGMTPNLIAGHQQGYAAIKAERSQLPTGVTLNILDFEPANEDSPVEQVRKTAYGAWMETCRTTGDFTGAQIYRQIPIPGKGKPLPRPAQLPFVEKGSFMAAFSQPSAIRNGLHYVYRETKKPIMISENGYDTDNDEHRVWYIKSALASLHEAITDGIPVLGYMHWSLIDNFEWESGFRVRYGLASVDPVTFERTPKPSANVLGSIAKWNSL